VRDLHERHWWEGSPNAPSRSLEQTFLGPDSIVSSPGKNDRRKQRSFNQTTFRSSPTSGTASSSHAEAIKQHLPAQSGNRAEYPGTAPVRARRGRGRHSGGEDDDRDRGGGFLDDSARLGRVRQACSDTVDDLDLCPACVSQTTTGTPAAAPHPATRRRWSKLHHAAAPASRAAQRRRACGPLRLGDEGRSLVEPEKGRLPKHGGTPYGPGARLLAPCTRLAAAFGPRTRRAARSAPGAAIAAERGLRASARPV
jgi:hypothetical protein